MNIEGLVDFNKPGDELDLHLVSTKSPIRPFQKYVAGLASGLRGNTSANLSITGPLSAPKLSGIAKLSRLDFTVNYLQTSYRADATLEVSNNGFTFLPRIQ